MNNLAYSKSALRTMRRMPPAMVEEIRARAMQGIDSQRLMPSESTTEMLRLEGQGWRITINAQGTVLVVAHVAPTTP